jgi:hypothetical protein
VTCAKIDFFQWTSEAWSICREWHLMHKTDAFGQQADHV